jgi:hypothetical protein
LFHFLRNHKHLPHFLFSCGFNRVSWKICSILELSHDLLLRICILLYLLSLHFPKDILEFLKFHMISIYLTFYCRFL